MSDSYQAIYDAVRSRISGGNVGEIVGDACRSAFDISHQLAIIQQEFCIAAGEMARPSVVFKPSIAMDGTMWCALLGDDLMQAWLASGKHPPRAMIDFDQNFHKQQTPDAIRLATAKGGANDPGRFSELHRKCHHSTLGRGLRE